MQTLPELSQNKEGVTNSIIQEFVYLNSQKVADEIVKTNEIDEIVKTTEIAKVDYITSLEQCLEEYMQANEAQHNEHSTLAVENVKLKKQIKKLKELVPQLIAQLKMVTEAYKEYTVAWNDEERVRQQLKVLNKTLNEEVLKDVVPGLDDLQKQASNLRNKYKRAKGLLKKQADMIKKQTDMINKQKIKIEALERELQATKESCRLELDQKDVLLEQEQNKSKKLAKRQQKLIVKLKKTIEANQEYTAVWNDAERVSQQLKTLSKTLNDDVPDDSKQ